MKLLISHATEDQQAASLLRELIERCSLKRIEIWFSSDQSGAGGMEIGVSWFPSLMKRFSDTDAIIALVTPNSVRSPWLYFECGILANKGSVSIIPTSLGMSIADIPLPLSAYQAYDLSTADSMHTFLNKLFQAAGVTFDSEMTFAIRERIYSELLRFSEANLKTAGSKSKSRAKELEELRVYLDNRFIELHSAISQLTELEGKTRERAEDEPILEDKDRAYPKGGFLRFEVHDSDGVPIKHFTVEWTLRPTIQYVLDECWYKMDHMVPAYDYLRSWVIREKVSGINFLSDRVNKGSDYSLASKYFSISNEYVIHLLDEPYSLNED
jgi:hypothetical protein